MTPNQPNTPNITPTPAPASFDGLGIAPRLLEILERLSFKTPTPIQQKAIPVAITGQDMMGIAQTGTGKTLAFGVPMIQRLLGNQNTDGLIILPTRELALQVKESLLRICRPLGLPIAHLIGGESIHRQIKELKHRPRIIIATPGRLNDHLNQKTLNLQRVGILVLDEADRMLDMGFAPQINRILQGVPKERQTMLFSATMPPQISQLAASYMKLPIRIEVATAGSTATNVVQEIFFVDKNGKGPELQKILMEYKGSVLIFCRTKHGVRNIARSVRTMGHTVSEIHSLRSQHQRQEALEGFKVGKYRVLVATDIAARGIHVSRIELVINYDLPDNPDDYVHRIGRTARAGHSGHAISFATPDQKRDVREIERLIKKSIPAKYAAGVEFMKSAPEPTTRQGNFAHRPKRNFSRGFGGRRGGRR
jgi:ATP-dependent RNA helicase RhlE